MKTFSTIKGLSEIRRLPRVGKIRLGIRTKNQKGTEYPKEVDYFVVPPEVEAIVGAKPKVLDIMIPVEDTAQFLPQAFKLYGSGASLICIGDGETAMRDEKKVEKTDTLAEGGEKDRGRIEVVCKSPDKGCSTPCAFGVTHGCRRTGIFRFLIPSVTMGGVYQIDTGSFNSIVDLNSAFADEDKKKGQMMGYIRALMRAATGLPRVACIPLKLKRVATETRYEGKKSVHYCLQVEMPYSLDQMKEKAAEITARRVVPAVITARPIEEEIEEDLIPASRQIEGGTTQAPTDEPDTDGDAGAPAEQPEEDPETEKRISDAIKILGWTEGQAEFRRKTFPTDKQFLEYLNREVDKQIAAEDRKRGNGNGAHARAGWNGEPGSGKGPQRSYSLQDIEIMRKGIDQMLLDLCKEDREEADGWFSRIVKDLGLKAETAKDLKAPEVIVVWRVVKDLHDKGTAPAVATHEPAAPPRQTNGKNETRKPAAAQEELPWRK
ncbi:MAG: hypothetical protein WCP22_03245 [Chlamydiota bacterium]